MKAAVVERPGELVVRDVPEPTINPWQALVQIKACAICNHTDAEIVAGRFGGNTWPLILGHESVGAVIRVGHHVSRYRVGDHVLRPGAMYNDPAVGIGAAWGGFAQLGVVGDTVAFLADNPGQKPHWSWEKQQIIPADIEPGEATAIITLKETLSVLKRVCPPGTAAVAIIGTGPVAQSFAFWARYLEVPTVAVFGRREQWRETVMARGATHYVVPGERAPLAAAQAQGIGPFPCIIEAVGSADALQTAVSLISPEGKVIPYGILPPVDEWPPALQDAKQRGLIGTAPVDETITHDEVLRLIAAGRLRLADWISHRLPLARIHEGFRLLEDKQATKVVIEIPEEVG